MCRSQRRRETVRVPPHKRTQSEAVPPKTSWVPYFVLGGFVSMLFLLAMLTGGVFWACRSVDWTAEESCPVLVSTTPPKKLNWLERLQRKDPHTPEYLVVRSDPQECTCRFLASLATQAMEQFLGPYEDSPNLTCTPQIVHDHDALQIETSQSQRTTYHAAHTSDSLMIPSEKQQLIVALGDLVEKNVDNWRERASNVSWGGNQAVDWFDKPIAGVDLDRLDGGHLLYSYLRIMQWPMPLQSTFPARLCSNGCTSDVALSHTLEFREKFKPWLVSPSTVAENANGCVFHHSFSPPLADNQNGRHSLVWIRPGRRVKGDDRHLTRAFVNTLEQAVAASLVESNGRVGKFNVVIDGDKFSWGLMPSVHHLTVFIGILQDHFPNRLGLVLLTNMGSIGEFLIKMVKPLISEEVRQKLVVLPKNEAQRQAILESVVGEESIPKWLGGTDSYEFNPDKYYAENMIVTDEVAMEYIETMPCHA
eukprot:Nitzschia sp. Nitz4//scaffold59_size112058//84840//86361//NITZ4_004121-RA/size112058-snap-gene-0.86-mRNA-1//-1//CDS//3329555159//6352//frame0